MDGKYREDQSANKAHLEQRLGKVIRDFDDDFDKVLASKASEIQFSFKHLNIDNELPFYLFSNDGELIYWSAIDMIPDFNNFLQRNLINYSKIIGGFILPNFERLSIIIKIIGCFMFTLFMTKLKLEMNI